MSLGVKFALTGWGWGKCWGAGSSGVAPAEVLDRFICLRTPFQFLPGPGDLPEDFLLSLLGEAFQMP